MEVILTINNLSKHYGQIHAVDDLSLQVEKGSIFGLLGPNGSGKTTTLGIILDVINPTRGSYAWFGNPSSSDSRKKIGAILEQPNFYPYLTAVQNLKIRADIKGASYIRIDEVLQLAGLAERKNSQFKTYSLGMKQRLAIAASLLNNPELLILDEPTNGLDPQGIAEVRELIIKVAKEGSTIILASHLLDEVQKVCTHVAVVKSGKKLFSGKVEEVLSAAEWVEVSAEDMEKLQQVLHQFPHIKQLNRENDKFVVSLSGQTNSKELNKYLHEHDLLITHLSTRKTTLEKQFLELLEKSK